LHSSPIEQGDVRVRGLVRRHRSYTTANFENLSWGTLKMADILHHSPPYGKVCLGCKGVLGPVQY